MNHSAHPDRVPMILASQSPRRRELLSQLDLPFEVRTLDVDESFPRTFRPEAAAVYIAEKKANAFLDKIQFELLISADTLVSIRDEILGKPKDRDDAIRMLQLLSGNVHEVITGVALLHQKKIYSFFEKTLVYFRQLTEEQISYYIDTYQPYDKAGAYGIQEWIGMIAVEKIEGSYTNVVGLPTARLYHEMDNFLQNFR